MIRLAIPEFGRIPRELLGSRMVRRLQAFDERQARGTGGQVFDWSHVHYVRALNYVGVVQVPGATIEILPKIDHSTSDGSVLPTGSAERMRAQQNLLYMLSLTRKLPLRDRDLASQHLQRLPLLDALILIFVRRLLTELRRGMAHEYLRFEENLRYVKGKLLISEHVRRNILRRDRTFVAYDEFTADTWLNRILRSTCMQLLAMTPIGRLSQHLREAMLELAEVSDVVIRDHHFQRVHLDRSSERYRPLLDFCRLVLLGMAPAPQVGGAKTFSLLFPMDQLFEAFIGRFLHRYASHFQLNRGAIHLQARRRQRWLLRTSDGSGRFRLRPDIVVDRHGQIDGALIDTKWKRLLADAEDRKNGVSQADVYQLYAYANRYGSRNNVLLYPRVTGVTAKDYMLDEDQQSRRIRVEFVDLSVDLRRNQEPLRATLRRVLGLPE